MIDPDKIRQIYCIHFTELSHGDKTKTCAAGIRYEDVVVRNPEDWPFYGWPYCYPCVIGSPVKCEKFSLEKEFTEW